MIIIYLLIITPFTPVKSAQIFLDNFCVLCNSYTCIIYIQYINTLNEYNKLIGVSKGKVFTFHAVTVWCNEDHTVVYLYLIINIPALHLHVTQFPLHQAWQFGSIITATNGYFQSTFMEFPF